MQFYGEVPVASVSSEMAAAIICARLRIRGIDCATQQPVLGGHDVLVPPSDLGAARALLALYAERPTSPVTRGESPPSTGRYRAVGGVCDTAGHFGEIVGSKPVELESTESANSSSLDANATAEGGAVRQPRQPDLAELEVTRTRKARERASMTAADLRDVCAQRRRPTMNGSHADGRPTAPDATGTMPPVAASSNPDPGERSLPKEPRETLHAVRFRSASVEFELTGSADAVADTLAMLAPIIATAFEDEHLHPSTLRTKKPGKGK